VQTLQVVSDGSVYLATLPGGKVYRIPPGQSGLTEESAKVVFDPAQVSQEVQKQPKYVWALTFDSSGDLYIGTGAPAAIYRVRAPAKGSKPELFFSSDEEHIRCLSFEPDGDLLAGSDGGGIVYRIDKNGKGFVLFNAPKREITSLAEAPDGRIYVASVGEKTKTPLPPLPVQGGNTLTATITIVAPGSVQASRSNSLIAQGSEVDELTSQGVPHKLWASPVDIVYALQPTPQGLLAGTGNRGRIYRISTAGEEYVDLARVEAGQVTALVSFRDGIYAATSNTGRLYRLDNKPAAQGEYLSDVFDSGVTSTWGRVEANSEDGGPSGAYELFVRGGNIENPERNWSPWQKVTPAGTMSSVPSARFLQWKAVLHPGARIGSVGINYLPANVAPVVDDIVVATGVKVNPAALIQPQPQPVTINLPSAQSSVSYPQDGASGALAGFKDKSSITVRWSAHDDNGDDLLFDLYFRGDGETNWLPLKRGVTDRFYTFDSGLLPDGGYRIMVAASDSPSHPAGQALAGTGRSEHFVIDTTPPAIAPLSANIEKGVVHVTFQATDAASPVTHAEYSLDAGKWQYLEPVGKISDSLTEHYDFTIPLHPVASGSAVTAADQIPGLVSDPREHVLAVRVYDRYDNMSGSKIVVRVP
jgi:hypothetical protein